jgi:hypothetical protein
MPAFNKYNSFLKTQMNGGAGTAARVVDFDTDTIKLAMVTSTYVPTPATHAVFSDITNEITGTNYTAGGSTLSGVTLTETGGVVSFTASNITYAQSGTGFSNARYAILYKSTGVAGTSSLIGYYDFGSNQSNVVVPFSIIFSGNVVITWQ